MNKMLAENVKTVNLLNPKDATGAAQVGLGVNLKGYARCNIKIITGALSSSDTMNVTLEQGTAGAGSASALTGAKALGFSWVWITDASTGIRTKTAVTANTFAIANTVTAGSVYEIELTADMLDAANGFVVVQPKISSPGAHATLIAVQADCYAARYAGSGAAMLDPLSDTPA